MQGGPSVAGRPASRGCCCDRTLECALHAQELVKQKFEPEKFAGVFSRGGSGPPRWLDGLLQDRCDLCSNVGWGFQNTRAKVHMRGGSCLHAARSYCCSFSAGCLAGPRGITSTSGWCHCRRCCTL